MIHQMFPLSHLASQQRPPETQRAQQQPDSSLIFGELASKPPAQGEPLRTQAVEEALSKLATRSISQPSWFLAPQESRILEDNDLKTAPKSQRQAQSPSL